MSDAATIWREAFEGEALGEALFARMAELAEDPGRREKLELLRRLEGSTRDLVRPVLDRLGIPTAGETAAAENGRTFGEAAASQPWEQLLDGLEANTAKYAAMYAELRPLAAPEDQAVVEALVDHERALCEFARRELAGDADPGAPIRALDHVDA